MSKSMSSAGSDAESLNVRSEKSVQQASTPVPAASPVPAKTSRFGFLSRKSKDDKVKLPEKPKREPRKMPAAGTGHERYGRFGIGYKSGSSPTPSSNRTPSTDSTTSNRDSTFLRRKSSGASDKTSELDDFLRERLSPVVLRGSGGQFSNITTPSMRSTPATNNAEWLTNTSGLTQSSSYRSLPQTSARPGTEDKLHDLSQRDAPIHGQAAKAVDERQGLCITQEQKPSRKWNFLQRLQSSPSKTPRDGTIRQIHQHGTKFDHSAHSALMDAIEPLDLLEVEQLIFDDDSAEVAGPSPPKSVLGSRSSLLPSAIGSQSKDKRRFATLPIAKEQVPTHESVIPAKPEQQQRATLHTPELNGSDSPRLPRLSPVGRIPRVVSKRDQERQPPNASFSRPFVNTQSRPNVKPPGALYSQIRTLASPAESAEGSSIQQRRSSRGEYAMHSATNLFMWPSRKNSEISCSSSSDTVSWMAYSRLQALQDEDVWNEYDDLMDDAALGKPSMYHKASFYSHQSPPFREGTAVQEYRTSDILLPREPAHALPVPPRVSRENSSTSVPQAGQQTLDRLIYNALSRQSTTSVNSSRDSRISARSRAASGGDTNVRSSHTSFSSTARMNRESLKGHDTARSAAEPSINLKLEALMTSKLLSFGRVLFSPAHNEMRLADEPRVLVLDGLGSDWSYFVAMYYSQATIYNLGPSGRHASGRDGIQQLPNHRNIAHTTLGMPLPFPKGFFTAAVFRFPIATTDEAYNACIAEFKRVLRPGGHLEVTVVDIDLGNAGSLARKAVRGLKTRMQQRDESISLRSLSDFLLQSIGKRGFEEVQRCIIGVPVMCKAAQASDGSSIDSETANTLLKASDVQGDKLAKLVQSTRDESAVNEDSDERMTKSVARVGRWWYSQCYERQVMSTDQSIWSDDALLAECQTQGTSVRLLICYAQKPTQAKRRTMSV